MIQPRNFCTGGRRFPPASTPSDVSSYFANNSYGSKASLLWWRQLPGDKSACNERRFKAAPGVLPGDSLAPLCALRVLLGKWNMALRRVGGVGAALGLRAAAF